MNLRRVKPSPIAPPITVELLPAESIWLRTVATAVPNTTEDIAKLVAPYIYPMKDLMRKKNGIGLAAPQIGIMWRFFLMCDRNGFPHIVINPKILKLSGKTSLVEEGCLSKPGFRRVLARDVAIFVEWNTTMAETRRMTLQGKEAFVFQHELDHLDGKVIF